MFADAIEKVTGYTRPVNTILRTYGSKQVIASSATLFFVNILNLSLIGNGL